MKKITLLFLMLLSISTFAQTHSTGVVNLTTGMTVRFDTNPTTVTMTLTGPSDRWFAIGIGVSSGFGMGAGDCLVYTTSLSDRKFQGTQNPAIDTMQNWTTTSNTVSGTTRTIVATRLLNTGDTAGSDYVFTNAVASISIAWALPGNATTTVSGHSSRGFATANQVLSNDTFALAGFKMYPNPADDLLAIELPADFETINAIIYDITGKEVLNKNLTALENKIDISALVSGNYFVRVSSGDKEYSTKLVVQ
jgi:hypothetical protein